MFVRGNMLILFCVTLWKFEASIIVSNIIMDWILGHVVASVPGSDHATRFLCIYCSSVMSIMSFVIDEFLNGRITVP